MVNRTAQNPNSDDDANGQIMTAHRAPSILGIGAVSGDKPAEYARQMIVLATAVDVDQVTNQTQLGDD